MIIYSSRFYKEIDEILDFIAKDSKVRADKFSKELSLRFKSIENTPKICRKSTSFDDKRDLIFKGYTYHI